MWSDTQSCNHSLPELHISINQSLAAETLPSYFVPVMVSVLSAAAEKSLFWNQTEPESVIGLHHKQVSFRQQIQFPVEQPCLC